MTQPYQNTTYKSKTNSYLENKNAYVFDLETNGLYNDVNEIYCLVIYDIKGERTITYGPDSIDAGLEHLAKGDILIGHNIIFYDIPVIRKLYPIYTFRTVQLIDTLVCARLIWPTEVLLVQDNEADYEIPSKLKGSASLKAWGYRLLDNKIDFKDFSAYSEEMAAYCRQDVQVTYKLFNYIQKQNYSKTALNLEHAFAQAINDQVIEGFPFDIDASLDLVDKLRQRKEELDQILQQMFPPIPMESTFIPKVNNEKRGYVKGVPFVKETKQKFNPGSRQQIVERLCAKYGWVPEKTTEKGNPIVNDDVLESLTFPEAKALVEYQLIKKRLGQIADGQNAWLKLVNKEDNRIHGDVITNGCITGRCSHKNPNMAQVPGVYSPYGKECRALFHVPKNYLLMGVDAKALELRCLAGYLARWDKGEYAALVVDPEIDIHTYNQERFGVSTRDISKRLLYACVPSDITTVLTTEGWKRYDELKVGQLVLTYNEEKEIKEWKPILEIIPEHEDDVFQMEHNHSFKVQTTLNHRWYVKKRTHNKNAQCGWKTGKNYMVSKVETTTEINTESNIIVNAPLIEEAREGIEIDWKWRKYGTNWSEKILQMNSKQRKAWLSGFMVADGFQSCRPNQKEKWHWTQIRNEHFEAALLASYLEFPGVIHVAKPRQNSSGTIQMHVSIANKSHVTGQKLQKTFVGKKKVFCIRTENKSFVMRQGDCITITGNCLYGAGSLKMGTIIDPNEKDETVLRKLGSTAINLFLEGVPALKALKDEINNCMATREYLIGLDSRKLYCRSAFKGLNVLLQSAGAILMKQVVINLNTSLQNLNLVYGEDWMQLAMIHDEIQLACLPEHKELVMAQALEAFPAAQKFFKFPCKIEGDAKIGYTWADTH